MEWLARFADLADRNAHRARTPPTRSNAPSRGKCDPNRTREHARHVDRALNRHRPQALSLGVLVALRRLAIAYDDIGKGRLRRGRYREPESPQDPPPR